ncbi:MAG: hypothetical protein WCY48_04140 [Candidatus Caldatribacteriota bacterium]
MFRIFRRFNRSLNNDVVRADLHSTLLDLKPENPFDLKMEALKKLIDWTKWPVTVGGETKDYYSSRTIRTKFLLQFLDRNEDLGTYFFGAISDLMKRGKATRLLYITGLTDHNGFFSEIADRMILRILPQTFTEKDLAEICRYLFDSPEDIVWIEQYAINVLEPFIQTAKKFNVSFDFLKDDLEDALIILGSHISSLGVTRQIRRHLDYADLSDLSFIKLSMAINRRDTPDQILKELTQCRINILNVRNKLEEVGVSVQLIYTIEKIESYLNRTEYLLHLRFNSVDSTLLAKFLSKLIADEQEHQGVKNFIQQNIHLLTKKIVERAGNKGDHYIAYNAQGRRQLFVAACWAGVLTAFTAVIKYWIGEAHFPYFFEGFFFFFNYSVSFLLMQYWHMALSSKQPAYTASALSRKFEDFKKTRELSSIISEVRLISYSQFLAFLGNFLWVVPITYLLDLIYRFSFGDSIVSEKEAYLILDKHSIFTSLTLLYAALTGVLLWLSSVISGWTENWVIYRNIPSLITQNSLISGILGKEKSRALAESLPGTISGIAGCLSISFFLAAPVIIGKIFGLPLDIRHVTLATGTVTLALSSLTPGLDQWYLYLEMLVSLTVIGILNFGVSFYCAIRMAATAREVHSKYLRIIFKFSLLRRAKKSNIVQETEQLL